MRILLTGGAGCSVLEVIAAAERVVGRPIRCTMASSPPGDRPVLVADPTAIGPALHRRPRRSSLGDILRTARMWTCGHPYGYAQPHAVAG